MFLFRPLSGIDLSLLGVLFRFDESMKRLRIPITSLKHMIFLFPTFTMAELNMGTGLYAYFLISLYICTLYILERSNISLVWAGSRAANCKYRHKSANVGSFAALRLASTPCALNYRGYILFQIFPLRA